MLLLVWWLATLCSLNRNGLLKYKVFHHALTAGKVSEKRLGESAQRRAALLLELTQLGAKKAEVGRMKGEGIKTHIELV